MPTAVRTFTGTVNGPHGSIFEITAPPTGEIIGITYQRPTISLEIIADSAESTTKRKFFTVAADEDIAVVNRPFIYIGRYQHEGETRFLFEKQPTDKVHQFRRLF